MGKPSSLRELANVGASAPLVRKPSQARGGRQPARLSGERSSTPVLQPKNSGALLYRRAEHLSEVVRRQSPLACDELPHKRGARAYITRNVSCCRLTTAARAEADL